MKIEVNFTLDAGDANVDVKQWAGELQLEPTEFGQKGEVSTRGKGHIISNSYWTIASARQDCDSIDDAVTSLLKGVAVQSKEVRKLVEGYKLDCGVAAFVWLEDDEDTSDIDLYLGRHTVLLLSDLYADFSVRVYE